MTAPFADVVSIAKELGRLYRPPTKLTAGKKLDHIESWVRVASVFVHCPASFQRATLWPHDSWRADAALGFDEFVRASLPEVDWPALGTLERGMTPMSRR